jgi:ABC-2 type transport system permease protein
MRTIRFLLQKEFLQVFRNKAMLPIIFIMPVIQLLVLSFAANYEIKNISLYVVDRDLSSFSRQLISRFQASPYFTISQSSFSYKPALHELETDRADIVLEIPRGFEKDLMKENNGKLHVTVNAINGSKAGVANNYAASIIADFTNEIRNEIAAAPVVNTGTFDVTFSNWFNPGLDYKTFMIPGILVVLVTMIGAFLSGMNIVKEKEIGTIEQLNVTPIKKHHFIIGKLLPFWIIALFEMLIGLGFAKLVFAIPIVGSLWVIFSFAALYLLVVLGMGLFISTITDTQQQAMFIAWFFIVIFILMSGLFTSVENMPSWAQKLTWINPIKYFVEVMRQVMLKGSSFYEVGHQFIIIITMALVINGLSVLNYRKTV